MTSNKYLIAIIPPEPIATEIYQLKEYFRDQYKSKASLNSPAHITLHMPFEYENEDKLVSTFKHFQTPPFTINLENFGCFEPRVIFVAVKKNPDLDSCKQRMEHFCKTELNLFNATYRDHPFHPHITIGFRDLKKPMFEAAWNEFKNKRYEASFLCTRITLLKHDGKFWQEFS